MRMESKLQSLKVAELKALLTAAGLGVSGNKPDLIQRLLANPQATTSLGVAQRENASASKLDGQGSKSGVPETCAVVAEAAVSGATLGTVTSAVEENNVATVASTPNNATTPAAESSEQERRQALITELEKRKARAAKFGQPLGEAERKLERAIKFGLDLNEEANVAKLAQPLGTRVAKSTEPQPARTKESAISKVHPETEEQKQHRLVEEEKARKRAQRFGIVASQPNDEQQHKRKRDVKPNTANTDIKKLKT